MFVASLTHFTAMIWEGMTFNMYQSQATTSRILPRRGVPLASTQEILERQPSFLMSGRI
jgi:hypothetical protein